MEAPAFGDIYIAKLQGGDNVQGGTRPVVVVSNNIGNRHSNIVEILPLSTQIEKAKHMPTHVLVSASAVNGLSKDSVVIAEQVNTINQSQLRKRIGEIEHEDLVKIGKARQIQSPFPSA